MAATSDQLRKLSDFTTINKKDSRIKKWYDQITSDLNQRFQSQPSSPSTFSFSERLVITTLLGTASAIFYILAFFVYAPLLFVKAGKFALVYSIANCFAISSFLFFVGFAKSMALMIENKRWISTVIYIFSFLATLYFAIALNSTMLTILFSIIQLVSIVWWIWLLLPSVGSLRSIWYRIIGSKITSQMQNFRRLVSSPMQIYCRGLKKQHEYAKDYGYEPSIYKGGPLPRLNYSELENKTPMPDHKVVDKWGPKRAFFGQNDYIDILGDGQVKPKHLTTGPAYLRGYKGNEYNRLLRKLQFEGHWIRRQAPKQYYNILIRMKHLYWRYNYKYTGKKYSVFIDA